MTVTAQAIIFIGGRPDGSTKVRRAPPRHHGGHLMLAKRILADIF
jgi:hypothetical protein